LCELSERAGAGVVEICCSVVSGDQTTIAVEEREEEQCDS